MILPLLLQAPADPMMKWALVAMAAGTILFTVVRPAFKKKDPLRKNPAASPFASSRLAVQRDTERQMQTLLVELSEMARSITAQLDTRSQKLELLIQQADERIALLRQQEQQQPMASAFRSSSTVDVFQPAHAYEPRREPALLPPSSAQDDARHQQIYALFDQGRQAGDIARELGQPRGEIELILALRPR